MSIFYDRTHTANTRLTQLVSLIFFLAALSSCTASRIDKTLDRSAVPKNKTEVSVNTSEIREVKDHGLGSGFGNEALNLRGQLFIKSNKNNSTQIQPCSGCTISMRTAADSSVKILLTTEKDGYFEFNGHNQTYTFFIDNPGMNPLEIQKVNFEAGGTFTLIIINAAGKTPEQFLLSNNGRKYTWNKL